MMSWPWFVAALVWCAGCEAVKAKMDSSPGARFWAGLLEPWVALLLLIVALARALA